MTPHKKGDLVYVPSSVMMVAFSTQGNRVDGHVLLPRPRNLLVVKEPLDGLLCVLYEGREWHVKTTDIYAQGRRDGWTD